MTQTHFKGRATHSCGRARWWETVAPDGHAASSNSRESLHRLYEACVHTHTHEHQPVHTRTLMHTCPGLCTRTRLCTHGYSRAHVHTCALAQVYTHRCTCKDMSKLMHTCLYTQTLTHTCPHCAHAHVYTHEYSGTCVHTCAYASVYTHGRTYKHTRTCLYTRMYTQTSVHTLMHTHT